MKTRIFNLLFALLLISSVATAQTLSVENITLAPGATGTLAVNISGATQMTALQFTLELPSGLSLAQESNECGIVLGSAAGNHTIKVTPLANGEHLVVLYSIEQKKFGDGPILTIPVVAGDEPGETVGALNSVRTATVGAVSSICPSATCTATIEDDSSSGDLRGDLNGDGVVSVTDIQCLVNIILNVE